MKQRTIKKSVSLKGVGLHTGKAVQINLKPAPEEHGIKFQRIDLEDQPIINADVNRVVSTDRSTCLQLGEAQVRTVEHVLSAIRGMDVDNVLLELDGPEVPIMDGSAGPFVNALQEAGIEEQNAAREYFIVEEPISYIDEVTGTELLALPCDHFELITMIDFDSTVLGQQYASFKQGDDYANQIAPCRTFVFVHELEALFQQGLIKGGDLDNAIVIADRKMRQKEELKYKNEPARHKLLDVIGDITLLGKPIKGKIIATKPGHSANAAFTSLLKKKYQEQRKLRGKPKYDPNKEPLFDVVQIAKWLPHRYPFLLVDKIIEVSETHVVGVKSVAFNELFFQGHFPGNPVMPGVLIIEALAQTGGILAINSVGDAGQWDTYFIKVDNVKFKNKVLPGDTLLLKMELLAPIRRGICQMQATAYVGNKIVTEGELTAQIVKRS
ncbi:UNVERIFIED_CONTAM: hypothetical protein GTU68_035477 [Idotea baltica]|nr:hypothetical protein [Idotea baltica]